MISQPLSLHGVDGTYLLECREIFRPAEDKREAAVAAMLILATWVARMSVAEPNVRVCSLG
jgi:hypothetical protein